MMHMLKYLRQERFFEHKFDAVVSLISSKRRHRELVEGTRRMKAPCNISGKPPTLTSNSALSKMIYYIHLLLNAFPLTFHFADVCGMSTTLGRMPIISCSRPT